MPISDSILIELDTPSGLESEMQSLRQQALDQFAKMLADEWTEQREKD